MLVDWTTRKNWKGKEGMDQYADKKEKQCNEALDVISKVSLRVLTFSIGH